MTALLKCQSNKHPWLNVLEKHKAAQLRCLLQMSMDVYNDTKCETISARSWPSRSLTSEFAQTLVSRFAEDWNAAFTPFVPTGEQMHYCHVNAYLEMFHCIAGDIREKLRSELQEATAVGIQVDGSCDRQQLNVKFVTCRIVNDTGFKTLFLNATEVKRRGAEGLLEAVGHALLNPATSNESQDEILIPLETEFDFKSNIFNKLRSVSTDGESANTGM
jgi:hypothetical protein